MKSIAEVATARIVEAGVNRVFALPGAAVYPLLDTLHKAGVEVCSASTEQALCFSASMWGSLSGKPGIVIVSSGPGLTNCVTALMDAAADGRPLLVIAGDVLSAHRGTGSFQDLGVLPTEVCKKLFVQCWPSRQDAHFDPFGQAIAHCVGGDHRPALISVSLDSWANPGPWRIHTIPSSTNGDSSAGVLARYERVLRLLLESPHPLVVLGARSRDPALLEMLSEFCATFDIPVAYSLGGVPVHSALADRSLGLVGVGAHEAASLALGQASFCLVVGDSFYDRNRGATALAIDCQVHVLHDHAWSAPGLTPMPSSLPLEPRALEAAMGRLLHGGDLPEVRAPREWARRVLITAPQGLGLGLGSLDATDGGESWALETAVKELLRSAAAEDLIVADCGNHQVALARELALHPGPDFETTRGFGVMGSALPHSLGASIAKPKRAVWCWTGDGGMAAAVGSLEQVARLDAPLRIVVWNDRAFGMVRDAQDREYSGRRVGSERPDTRFSAIALAFGVPSRLVRTQSEWRSAISMLGDTPMLLELLS